jgi:hypothetical protein
MHLFITSLPSFCGVGAYPNGLWFTAYRLKFSDGAGQMETAKRLCLDSRQSRAAKGKTAQTLVGRGLLENDKERESKKRAENVKIGYCEGYYGEDVFSRHCFLFRLF